MKKRKININETTSLSKKRFGKETWQLSKEEKLQFAIENCRRIRITYDDKKGGKGKNTRYLLPLVYGITKYGKKAIRAFQTYGSTKRGVPKYKLFLTDNIGQIEVGKIKYYDYEQQLLNTGFNSAGDKGFSDIYSITPLARNFNGASLANQNQPIDSKPVKKSDINKGEEEPKETKPTTKQPTQTINTQQKTVDNLGKKSYFNNKIEAPDTEPVSKSEIENGEKAQQPTQMNQSPVEYGDETEPVEKNDVEPQINTDNVLSKSYKDMMNRMDNLYKDEDEEDEDNL